MSRAAFAAMQGREGGSPGRLPVAVESLRRTAGTPTALCPSCPSAPALTHLGEPAFPRLGSSLFAHQEPCLLHGVRVPFLGVFEQVVPNRRVFLAILLCCFFYLPPPVFGFSAGVVLSPGEFEQCHFREIFAQVLALCAAQHFAELSLSLTMK